jgi:hypothetical protein
MLYILTGTLKNVGLDHGNVYSKENHWITKTLAQSLRNLETI